MRNAKFHLTQTLEDRVQNSKLESRDSKRETLHRRTGFTLIELLIVLAIITVLVAVMIPSHQSSVRKANEASAVSTLNAIRVAQAKYALDHKSHYGTFPQLFEEGYLDKRFNAEKPHHQGYVFLLTIVDKTEESPASFSVNANPEKSQGVGATGKNFYYIDPESGICFSKSGPATAADESL